MPGEWTAITAAQFVSRQSNALQTSLAHYLVDLWPASLRRRELQCPDSHRKPEYFDAVGYVLSGHSNRCEWSGLLLRAYQSVVGPNHLVHDIHALCLHHVPRPLAPPCRSLKHILSFSPSSFTSLGLCDTYRTWHIPLLSVYANSTCPLR